MRVVTWNVEFGHDVEQPAQDLTTLDELSGADIVLLQEMDRSGTDSIVDTPGAESVFAAAATHPETGREMGNAIVSPWPIRAATEVDLSHTARFAGQPRSAMHAIVDVAGTQIATYSVHTETVMLTFGKRREQFATVANHIGVRDDDAAVVVGGDFNTARGQEIDALASVRGPIDATSNR